MGVLRFITMSYTTKSEQSEWNIHDPMKNACGCGGKGHSIFLSARSPLGMTGIRTLKFWSAPFKKINPKGTFFARHLWQISPKGPNFVGSFEEII